MELFSRRLLKLLPLFREQEREIMRLRREVEFFQKQTMTDSLTGLSSRLFLESHLSRILAGMRRKNGRQELRREIPVFMFIDIDNFKQVNDTYGHKTGDRVLQEISHRLLACVRPRDVAARFGGDEFAVLLDSVHDTAEALLVAKRINTAVRKPFFKGNESVDFISASVGVLMIGSNYNNIDDIVADADKAMYHAKVRGGDRYALY